jgi:hypothetical protein
MKHCKLCGCEFSSDLAYCEICRLYLLNVERLKKQASESLQERLEGK